MGCGSSSQVVPEHEMANGHTKKTENGNNFIGDHEDDDDLPTVLLTDTPVKSKAPIAFEIPLEELDITRKEPPSTPPPQIQRLLQPPQADITLPDIEEKLAIAEARRQTLLLQRAASAQKKTHKMLRAINGMHRVDSEQGEATDSENQTGDSFDIEPQTKSNSRPPTVDLGKRSTFPQSVLPRASIDEELQHSDNNRSSIDGKRSSIDGKMPSTDGKRPSIDIKRQSVDVKRPSVDNKRSSMDGANIQMDVKRTMTFNSGIVDERCQSNEIKDIKTPQTIERKNSTDLRRMR